VCCSLFHYGYYPDEGDPKNIKYVLWKHGLYKMDLDLATEVMVGDPHRESLVIGKTEAQLKKRFGYLLTPDEASFYVRACTSDRPSIKLTRPMDRRRGRTRSGCSSGRVPGW
jgi:hypothetical protein